MFFTAGYMLREILHSSKTCSELWISRVECQPVENRFFMGRWRNVTFEKLLLPKGREMRGRF